MKSALFLDDEIYRHQCFVKWYANEYAAIDCVRTNVDAIHLLQTRNYDLVCLDFDLTTSEGEGTNTVPTAEFVAAMKKPPLVRVHSRNNLMAPKLWKFLAAYGVPSYQQPFGEAEEYKEEFDLSMLV